MDQAAALHRSLRRGQGTPGLSQQEQARTVRAPEGLSQYNPFSSHLVLTTLFCIAGGKGGIEHRKEFTDDIKLGEVVGMLEGSTAIQKDLNKLEK
ncbi:hypothetical protein llap_16732 [Limosa lapponica baueri]|uniref:Rna-directed dna polymerase from mobile element jockey-like n=1 Tax=Limosa lapponica baueri TaxID=1758121 RepID=A0A2I0TGN7_LIMLA|nr:hypothetical protein llap_16732 [Limosa lapponica baueri]